MYLRQMAKRESQADLEDGFARGPLIDELGWFAFIYCDPPNQSEMLSLEASS